MTDQYLVGLDVASAYLGKCKQTLRRWDEEQKLKSVRSSNGYRLYDFRELAKLGSTFGKARPFVKWAGGKTQLLPELLRRTPENYSRYLEPFVGGGALFFALNPETAILNDINSELITSYRVIRDTPEELICLLREYKHAHNEDFYYRTREREVDELDALEIAARFIYLNRTCFNGLYRVNQQGRFNVPIGRYKNPPICDAENIRMCSEVLQGVTLSNLSYQEFLDTHVEPGDFVYIDPPYIPASIHSDFDRYDKQKFRLGSQVELANRYRDLVHKDVHVILSNSETPLSNGLYAGFSISSVSATRSINKKADKRGHVGEILVEPTNVERFQFPTSRYMGSKSKLLPYITEALSGTNYRSVFDGFSGSGVVSYHFKKMGYTVTANDFLHYSSLVSKATVENSSVRLLSGDVDAILKKNRRRSTFVQDTFRGLYFSDEDNAFLDNVLPSIHSLECEYKKAIALSALSRACLKRRPRGLFTYVGFRYDDGRKDLSLSLNEHFLIAVSEFNAAIFDNGRDGHKSLNTQFLELPEQDVDLIYLDPPYFSMHSDNDYTRRYHFIEGICRNWEGITIQEHTKTKKFKRYPSPFDTKAGTYRAFEEIINTYKDKALLISYSSNSLPTLNEIISLLEDSGKVVKTWAIDYSYSFGNQGHKVDSNNNSVQEYLFLAQ